MFSVSIDPGRWPVNVACVSDTHVPRRARAVPGALLEALAEAGVDLILHAGDLTVPEVLADLGAIARVLAVAGNVDPPDLAGALPPAVLLAVGPWRVGLVHGHLGPERDTPGRALGAFAAGDRPDVVVFGHSHQPLLERRDGILLLNPGSPTDPRRAPWPSWGLLVLPGPGESPAEPWADLRRVEVSP